MGRDQKSLLSLNMTLDEITEKLEKDPRNRSYTDRGIGPIYQIHKESRILIISQAPGRVVEVTGLSFNDLSGDLLRKWLGMDRELFYSDAVSIMPMDFYYPGKGKSGDKPPRPFIAREYHALVLRLMPEIRLTILVGSYAMKYYLKKEMYPTLTETVRHYQQYLPEYFPIVHPSPLNIGWRKKNPWFEKEAVPVLQKKVKEALNG